MGVTQFAHIIDLHKLMDRVTQNGTTRIECLYRYEYGDDCTTSCTNYQLDRQLIFDEAVKCLAKEIGTVDLSDFTAVMRTFFCKEHDIMEKNKAYKDHIENIWADASRELRSNVWDVLRNSGRCIHPPTPSTPKGARLHPSPAKSAPSMITRKDLEASSDIQPIVSNLNAGNDSPGRPRIAQAKLSSRRKPAVDETPTKTLLFNSKPLTDDCEGHKIKDLTSRFEVLCAEQRPKLSGNRKIEQPPEQLAESSEKTIFQVIQERAKSSKSDEAGKLECHDILPDLTQKNGYHAAEPLAQTPSRPFVFGTVGSMKNDQRRSPLRGFQVDPNEHIDFGLPIHRSPLIGQEKSSAAAKASPVPNIESGKQGQDPTRLKEETPEMNPPLDRTVTPPHETPPTEHGLANPSPTKGTESPDDIASRISKLLQKPLGKYPGNGTMYILEAPNFPPATANNEKWIKIGITTDLDERKKSFTTKCGITELKTFRRTHMDNERMDLLQRVEKVCHAQLSNFQRIWICKPRKCKTKEHGEWFALDPEVALRTVLMWVDFLEHNPYDEHNTLRHLWRDALRDKKKFRLVGSGHAGEDPEELLHRYFEKWIETTVKSGHKLEQGAMGSEAQ